MNYRHLLKGYVITESDYHRLPSYKRGEYAPTSDYHTHAVDDFEDDLLLVGTAMAVGSFLSEDDSPSFSSSPDETPDVEFGGR
jgi:hypothetical protein